MLGCGSSSRTSAQGTTLTSASGDPDRQGDEQSECADDEAEPCEFADDVVCAVLGVLQRRDAGDEEQGDVGDGKCDSGVLDAPAVHCASPSKGLAGRPRLER